MKITHAELCQLTAKRFIRDHKVGVFEYQSYASGEFPDVLLYDSRRTFLFEIKVSRSDFLADAAKFARRNYSIKYICDPNYYSNHVVVNAQNKPVSISLENLAHNRIVRELWKEYPHLGSRRYYVCPENLISPDEIKNGFGLWYFNEKTKRFKAIKESKEFRNDMHAERDILIHALRAYVLKWRNRDRILVKPDKQQRSKDSD